MEYALSGVIQIFMTDNNQSYRSESDDSGIDVPITSIDPDATLQERMTDNAWGAIGPSRYFQKDEDGNPVEDWNGVFNRVATNVAVPEAVHHDLTLSVFEDELADWVDEETKDDLFDGNEFVELDEEIAPYVDYEKLLERAPDEMREAVEDTADRFERAMRELRFMPNTPTLINAGTELQQLSACFVLFPGDSLVGEGDGDTNSIMRTAEEAAAIFKSGGGVGYPLHLMRPKGAIVSSTGGVSSGPMSFAQVYDTVCSTIQQGGCVANSERVMTDRGYVPMSEVYDGPPLDIRPNDSMVYTRGGGMDSIIESSDSSTMETVTVKTESGYELTVTDNHPLMVLEGGELEFKPAGDLTSEDTVVLSSNDKRTDRRQHLEPLSEDHYHTSNIPDSLPETMTDDLARFLGILWGDGCVSPSGDYGRVVFTLGNDGNGDESAQDFLLSFMEKYGLEYTTKNKSETEKGNYTRIEIGSTPLVEWMEKNGLVKDSDALESIPEAIYRSPAAIPAFLDGLTVDGCHVPDAGTVRYSTVSEEFAKVIQDLLLVCGIPSTRYVDENTDGKYSDNPQHCVRVFPGEYAEKYAGTVQSLLDGEVGTTSGERQNSITDPDVYERILGDHFEKNNKLPEGVDKKSVKRLRRYARGDRYTSLQRARNTFEKAQIDPDEYEVLSTENLFEKVEDVVVSGPEQVCDIENKTGEPEFVASNFVVHNVRRGAQMAIMHSQHPDVGRFAVAKRDEENLSNFNISVAITDEFLEAVREDSTYTLVDPQSGYSDPEAFEVVAETAHFYDPRFEDAWNDEQNNPGMGLDGKVVEENFWRDHLAKMGDPEAFDEFRDRIHLEPGEPMELPARFIWQLIVDGAHHLGEPGFYYIDEANREHSFDVEDNYNEYLHATNPCGEQSLTDGEPCNLGHVNLSLMVDEDSTHFDEWKLNNFPDFDEFSKDKHIEEYVGHALDLELFEETVRTGTEFLDNVITMSKFPLDKIEREATEKRKIGLGLMGFHQMLLQMGVQYGTDESYAIAEEVMRRIDKIATETSHELALERGSFERWDESKWSDPEAYPEWFEKHGHQDPKFVPEGYPIRNHNLTTIAPTGTTSMIGNTTGGCEPMYNVAYYKNVSNDVQGDEMLVEFDDYFLRVLEANGVDVSAVKRECGELMRNNDFDSVNDLETVPDGIAELFVTTEDLDVEQHIRVQAAFQTYCDSSISKTLNIANEATLEDVGRAINLAIDLGCKGGTIYRVGSRTEEVLTTSTSGGAVALTEADDEDLLEELADRVEDEPDLRANAMSELDVVDTTVEVEEDEKEKQPVRADGGSIAADNGGEN